MIKRLFVDVLYKFENTFKLRQIRAIYYILKIRNNVRYDREKIIKEQLKRLRKVMINAYENTDYYKKVFDKNKFNPYDIVKIEDISVLPVLTKKDIQNNEKAIFSKKFKKEHLIMHSTSGSTGVPLRIYNDNRCESYNIALRYRAYLENGYRLKDKIVEFTSPDSMKKNYGLLRSLQIFKMEKLSIFKKPEKSIDELNRIAPNAIIGYPSVLYLISERLSEKNLEFKPKVIFTTAELLLGNIRKKIEESFGCDVIDMFGCEEFNRLAWECEKHEGYHLDEDLHIIEFLDMEDNPITEGEGYFVVTSLTNFAFPLIRYKIGDIARLDGKKCTCDRTLRVIESIQGRNDDFIKLPSGKIISPRTINIIEDIKGIRRYRIIQNKEGNITVEVVKNEEYTEKTRIDIQKQIRLGCGNEKIRIAVNIVDEIKKEKSGKLRTIVSNYK